MVFSLCANDHASMNHGYHGIHWLVSPQRRDAAGKMDALIAVGVALEGTIRLHADVGSLLRGHLGELSPKGWEVEPRNLLIKRFGQQVHIILVRLGLFPILQEIQLCKNLVREGAGHHERGMTCRTTQVQQAAGCENDDTVSVREDKAINLWLDVLDLNASHVNLIVEVPDVANYRIIFHLLHVCQGDDF